MQINPYDALPDIDFTIGDTESITNEMIATYEKILSQETGKREKLPLSSRERLILLTMAYQISVLSQKFADRARMNLPKYSRGDYLDVLASFWGLTRREAAPAVGVVEFTLSAVREEDILIPKGTRVSPGNKLFYQTDEDLVIRSPSTSGQVGITCQVPGQTGNGYQVGTINIVVDPIAYVDHVSNVGKTQGGADIEDDESLRIRIYYAPKGYSVAGPLEAYKYLILNFSQAIESVSPWTPAPGEVEVCITLQGGEIPEPEYLQRIMDYMEPKRPVTDHLTLRGPDVVDYDIDLTYYINKNDANNEFKIKEAVEEVISQYFKWQETIGRDLNPDKLTELIIRAGAKRLEIVSPVRQVISRTEIFKHKQVSVKYGGLEDD